MDGFHPYPAGCGGILIKIIHKKALVWKNSQPLTGQFEDTDIRFTNARTRRGEEEIKILIQGVKGIKGRKGKISAIVDYAQPVTLFQIRQKFPKRRKNRIFGSDPGDELVEFRAGQMISLQGI